MLRLVLVATLVSRVSAQIDFPRLMQPLLQPTWLLSPFTQPLPELPGLPKLPGQGEQCCNGETTTEEPTTTEDPNKSTTTNGYQALGWETDDDGNVFWGNDIGKIYLYQMPAEKYWAPIPKDWPEGPLVGSLWPDSPNYRPIPPGYIIPGGIKTGIQVPFPPNTPKQVK